MVDMTLRMTRVAEEPMNPAGTVSAIGITSESATENAMVFESESEKETATVSASESDTIAVTAATEIHPIDRTHAPRLTTRAHHTMAIVWAMPLRHLLVQHEARTEATVEDPNAAADSARMPLEVAEVLVDEVICAEEAVAMEADIDEAIRTSPGCRPPFRHFLPTCASSSISCARTPVHYQDPEPDHHSRLFVSNRRFYPKGGGGGG